MQLHHYVCEELKNMALFVENTPTAWLLLNMKQTENRSHAALSLFVRKKSRQHVNLGKTANALSEDESGMASSFWYVVELCFILYRT